jgi:hypothetical protein
MRPEIPNPKNFRLQARINKRFESIENDRQEDMVDILNSINEKSGDFSELLKKLFHFLIKRELLVNY